MITLLFIQQVVIECLPCHSGVFSPPVDAMHHASTRKSVVVAVTAKSLPDRAYVFILGELMINRINNKIVSVLLSGKCYRKMKCSCFLEHLSMIYEDQDHEKL